MQRLSLVWEIATTQVKALPGAAGEAVKWLRKASIQHSENRGYQDWHLQFP